MLAMPGNLKQPVPDPSSQLRQLEQDIEKLKAELGQANIQLDSSQQLHELLIGRATRRGDDIGKTVFRRWTYTPRCKTSII